jgi:hypothetical protein
MLAHDAWDTPLHAPRDASKVQLGTLLPMHMSSAVTTVAVTTIAGTHTVPKRCPVLDTSGAPP